MRKLSGHKILPPVDFFAEIHTYLKETLLDHDVYGTGPDKEDFEHLVATDFGYESAIFIPSGVMAQLIAMRIVCDQSGNPTIGIHASSHLEKHEEMSYSHLHSLDAQFIGQKDKVPTAEDIKALPKKVSAIIYELPMRHLGGALPSWAELQGIKSICKEGNIHLHIDGARLWETMNFYNKPLADITTGCQSCYISFYKGIGSTSGAMLMGNHSFITEAKIWLRRHGGDLVQLSPLWIPAKLNYEKRKDCFKRYFDTAKQISEILVTISGIEVTPYPIQTNMMHILIDGTPMELTEKMKRLDEKLGYSCRLSCWGIDSIQPKKSRFELYVAEAASEISSEEIREYFTQLTK